MKRYAGLMELKLTGDELEALLASQLREQRLRELYMIGKKLLASEGEDCLVIRKEGVFAEGRYYDEFYDADVVTEIRLWPPEETENV